MDKPGVSKWEFLSAFFKLIYLFFTHNLHYWEKKKGLCRLLNPTKFGEGSISNTTLMVGGEVNIYTVYFAFCFRHGCCCYARTYLPSGGNKRGVSSITQQRRLYVCVCCGGCNKGITRLFREVVCCNYCFAGPVYIIIFSLN